MQSVGKLRSLVKRGLDRVGDRGMETASIVEQSQFYENPDNLFYLPSSWFALRRGLRGYRVGPEDVFIDFGAGKGRVLYQAARRPFKRVIGVELDPQLAAIAERNLDQNHARLRCQDVELLTGDMTAIEVPDDVTVAFMFNAVRGETLTRLMANIVASLDRRPRRLRLIYSWPVEPERVDATGRFRQIAQAKRPWESEPSIRVYEGR